MSEKVQVWSTSRSTVVGERLDCTCYLALHEESFSQNFFLNNAMSSIDCYVDNVFAAEDHLLFWLQLSFKCAKHPQFGRAQNKISKGNFHLKETCMKFDKKTYGFDKPKATDES
jgi:hypothetical protein